MTIYEAMRRGAVLKPQAFDVFRFDGVTCALGAVADALGLPDTNDDDVPLDILAALFPQLTKPALCPACSFVRGTYRRWRKFEEDLMDVVIHLNDDHRWTREAIANWLGSSK